LPEKKRKTKAPVGKKKAQEIIEAARESGQTFVELAEEDYMALTPDINSRSFTDGIPAVRIYVDGEKEDLDKLESEKVY